MKQRGIAGSTLRSYFVDEAGGGLLHAKKAAEFSGPERRNAEGYRSIVASAQRSHGMKPNFVLRHL